MAFDQEVTHGLTYVVASQKDERIRTFLIVSQLFVYDELLCLFFFN